MTDARPRGEALPTSWIPLPRFDARDVARVGGARQELTHWPGHTSTAAPKTNAVRCPPIATGASTNVQAIPIAPKTSRPIPNAAGPTTTTVALPPARLRRARSSPAPPAALPGQSALTRAPLLVEQLRQRLATVRTIACGILADSPSPTDTDGDCDTTDREPVVAAAAAATAPIVHACLAQLQLLREATGALRSSFRSYAPVFDDYDVVLGQAERCVLTLSKTVQQTQADYVVAEQGVATLVQRHEAMLREKSETITRLENQSARMREQLEGPLSQQREVARLRKEVSDLQKQLRVSEVRLEHERNVAVTKTLAVAAAEADRSHAEDAEGAMKMTLARKDDELRVLRRDYEKLQLSSTRHSQDSEQAITRVKVELAYLKSAYADARYSLRQQEGAQAVMMGASGQAEALVHGMEASTGSGGEACMSRSLVRRGGTIPIPKNDDLRFDWTKLCQHTDNPELYEEDPVTGARGRHLSEMHDGERTRHILWLWRRAKAHLKLADEVLSLHGLQRDPNLVQDFAGASANRVQVFVHSQGFDGSVSLKAPLRITPLGATALKREPTGEDADDALVVRPMWFAPVNPTAPHVKRSFYMHLGGSPAAAGGTATTTMSTPAAINVRGGAAVATAPAATTANDTPGFGGASPRWNGSTAFIPGAPRTAKGGGKPPSENPPQVAADEGDRRPAFAIEGMWMSRLDTVEAVREAFKNFRQLHRATPGLSFSAGVASWITYKFEFDATRRLAFSYSLWHAIEREMAAQHRPVPKPPPRVQPSTVPSSSVTAHQVITQDQPAGTLGPRELPFDVLLFVSMYTGDAPSDFLADLDALVLQLRSVFRRRSVHCAAMSRSTLQGVLRRVCPWNDTDELTVLMAAADASIAFAAQSHYDEAALFKATGTFMSVLSKQHLAMVVSFQRAVAQSVSRIVGTSSHAIPALLLSAQQAAGSTTAGALAVAQATGGGTAMQQQQQHQHQQLPSVAGVAFPTSTTVSPGSSPRALGLTPQGQSHTMGASLTAGINTTAGGRFAAAAKATLARRASVAPPSMMNAGGSQKPEATSPTASIPAQLVPIPTGPAVEHVRYGDVVRAVLVADPDRPIERVHEYLGKVLHWDLSQYGILPGQTSAAKRDSGSARPAGRSARTSRAQFVARRETPPPGHAPQSRLQEAEQESTFEGSSSDSEGGTSSTNEGDTPRRGSTAASQFAARQRKIDELYARWIPKAEVLDGIRDHSGRRYTVVPSYPVVRPSAVPVYDIREVPRPLSAMALADDVGAGGAPAAGPGRHASVSSPPRRAAGSPAPSPGPRATAKPPPHTSSGATVALSQSRRR